MKELSAVQLAHARHHTYTLFSWLYLRGITADLLPTLHAIPELAAVLPEPFHPDEAAADYQRLFGFNLFPYEAVFLDRRGLLGGPFTEAVSHRYRQMGFWPDSAAASPDHIGVELALLAFLARAEADAWEDGETAAAQQLRRRQANFLHAHLLRWLPPFIQAVRQQGHPFYTALADLALDFVTAEVDLLPQANPAQAPFLLPEPPPLLANEKTGLKEIAAYLMSPPYSAVFLSRDDIGRLAHQHRLPRGFAGREQMLLNLFRSAVRYDAFPSLIATLQQWIGAWQQAYETIGLAHPELLSYTAVWQARAAETAALLLKIGSISEIEPI